MNQAALLTNGPALSEQAMAELEWTGKLILRVRQPYLDRGHTLAWLYNIETMPADLRLAHKLNDEAVDRAYGYTGDGTDADRAAFLFDLYQRYASGGQGNLLERAYGYWPKGQIDHINGIKTDNRLANLRDVSRTINQQNMRRAPVNSRAGFLGAGTVGKRFRVRIRVNGRPHHIWYFATPELAHSAYVKAKRIYHEGCTL